MFPFQVGDLVLSLYQEEALFYFKGVGKIIAFNNMSSFTDPEGVRLQAYLIEVNNQKITVWDNDIMPMITTNLATKDLLKSR